MAALTEHCSGSAGDSDHDELGHASHQGDDSGAASEASPAPANDEARRSADTLHQAAIV